MHMAPQRDGSCLIRNGSTCLMPWDYNAGRFGTAVPPGGLPGSIPLRRSPPPPVDRERPQTTFMERDYGEGGVFAQRGHSANYYGDYPGNNPENHPPAESCTINSKLKNSNI